MTRQTSYILFALILAIIVGVVVLIIMESDVEKFTDFLSVVLIPTIVALWAGNRADKAGQIATRAADSAEQAVANTNGRMGELIRDALENGRTIDTARYADVIEAQGIEIPTTPKPRPEYTNESLRNTPIE